MPAFLLQKGTSLCHSCPRAPHRIGFRLDLNQIIFLAVGLGAGNLHFSIWLAVLLLRYLSLPVGGAAGNLEEKRREAFQSRTDQDSSSPSNGETLNNFLISGCLFFFFFKSLTIPILFAPPPL